MLVVQRFSIVTLMQPPALMEDGKNSYGLHNPTKHPIQNEPGRFVLE